MISPQYIADLVSWGAIGARTTESQVHRELASGLSMPVGFKNGTDGNIQIAIDAIQAAGAPAPLPVGARSRGRSAIVATARQPGLPRHPARRQDGPNYDAASVARGCARAGEGRSCRLRLMIDCSHANSSKDPYAAAGGGARRRRADRPAGAPHLRRDDREPPRRRAAGRRAGQAADYGQSITDACIGWSDTVPTLRDLAEPSAPAARS